MTREQPLLLGEAPSRTGDRYYRFPLSGSPAKLVCDLLSIRYSRAQYDGPWWQVREHFEVANLIERYPGPQGRGAAFPIGPAREAWAELWPTLSGRVVVLLGARLPGVAGVWADEGESVFHQWWQVWSSSGVTLPEAATIVAIPHPSGLNRMYNDPAEREKTAATLRQAIRRTTA
jgi:hypothetical protein